VLSSLLALLAAPARAHAQIDEGMRLMDDADFAGAVSAFDRAESGPLDRAALLRLLAGRAMARWATGDAGFARRDLAGLRSLDGAFELPPEAPPDLVAVFEEASPEPLVVHARWDTSDGIATLVVSAVDDPGRLVRSTRLHVRVGQGAWQIPTLPVSVALAAGEHVAAYVELVGPGGAILATAGSESDPILDAPTAPAAALAPDAPAAPADQTGLFIGLGVGIGVAVIAAIVIAAVVLGSVDDSTQPRLPVVVGF
jgi:hypothetical protein